MLLLPDVLHCKHLLVCRRWGGLNGSFSSTDTSSSQKSNVCFYCRAAAFREHFRTFKFSIFLNRSYEFKRQGFSSGVYWQRGDRECYMVRARRVDTADFMQGKYLSCSHQDWCVLVRPWQLSLITFERAHGSLEPIVTPIGVMSHGS